MNRLILFLVRKKLRLKKNERFRFVNQKTNNIYYISSERVVKTYIKNGFIYREPSNVSLNWLLDPECEIRRMDDVSAYF